MIKNIPGTLKTFVSLNDRPPLQAILQSLWYFVHLIYHGNHNSPTHSLVLINLYRLVIVFNVNKIQQQINHKFSVLTMVHTKTSKYIIKCKHLLRVNWFHALNSLPIHVPLTKWFTLWVTG